MKKERPLVINLHIQVSDGSFETRLSFPVDVSKEAIQNIMTGWFQAIESALKVAV